MSARSRETRCITSRHLVSRVELTAHRKRLYESLEITSSRCELETKRFGFRAGSVAFVTARDFDRGNMLRLVITVILAGNQYYCEGLFPDCDLRLRDVGNKATEASLSSSLKAISHPWFGPNKVGSPLSHVGYCTCCLLPVLTQV